MGEETLFTVHLSKYARQYFTEFSAGPVRVDFIGKQTRMNSTFYRFDMSMGNQHRRVLVKVIPPSKAEDPRESPTKPVGEDRPRLTAKADLATKSHLEYKMLSTLHAYFGQPDNRCFGALHPLDFLLQQRAIVMEEEKAPSLRQIFAKTNRLKYPFRSLNLSHAFFHAGAWLRAYHAFPKLEHTQVRHDGCLGFTKSVTSFTDFWRIFCPIINAYFRTPKP